MSIREDIEARDAARALLPHRGGRAAIGAAGIGAILLATMLFRGVIAAQTPPGPASATSRVASEKPHPIAPAAEAGRGNH